ncbi:MAG: orotate phosphoribosyltransferase [Candidatus Anstonellaceae archaeon]
MEALEKNFVLFLEKKKCIKIANNLDEFFLLKSGRKCPIFINIGSLIEGSSLLYLAESYASKIYRLLEQKELENFDYIYGPAYKGIVLGSITALMLYKKYKIETKFIYDRKEQKEYGDKKADSLIVGQDQIKDGASVLMIDDVITSGKAKIEAYQKLISVKKIRMVGVLVAIDRQEKTTLDGLSTGEEIEKNLGCRLYSIANIGDIYSALYTKLNKEQKKYFLDYFFQWGEEKVKKWIEVEKQNIEK